MRELSIKKVILLILFFSVVNICLLIGIMVQKSVCDNVYILSFSQEDKEFSNNEISELEEKDISLTYVKYVYPEISSEICLETATVIATNSNYLYFTGMEIRAGTFFNDMQVSRKLAVVVLNEVAAYQFFGNYDCIGEKLYLDKKDFKVVGIVREQSDKIEAKIYIPDTTAEILGISSGGVKQLWCQFSNIAETSVIMQQIGHSLDEMRIIQMDLCKKVFHLRYYLIFVLIGIKFIMSAPKRSMIFIKRKNRVEVFFSLSVSLLYWMILFLSFPMVWCRPPYYELIGKTGINLVCNILKFYTLSGLNIREIDYLNQWNLLSLLSFIICALSVIKFYVNNDEARSRTLF